MNMEFFGEAGQLAPPLLLAAALNVVGFAVKRSPIPDWLIPILLISIGATVYPLIGEVGKVAYECRNPQVYLAIYGAMIGGSSVAANQVWRQVLGKSEEPKPQ